MLVKYEKKWPIWIPVELRLPDATSNAYLRDRFIGTASFESMESQATFKVYKNRSQYIQRISNSTASELLAR